MTANRNFKRRVRARAAKTGESYTSARRHLSDTRSGDPMPDPIPFRLAVAQTTLRGDPNQPDELRDSGTEIRRLLRQAHEEGARLVHFAEGATTWPDKRLLSSTGPDEVGAADWDRLDWDVLAAELEAIAVLARELRLWVVVGAPHRLTPPHRPHNSLYVIDDRGRVVTRYDERMLSNTKLRHLYAPGSEPVTFDVDGVRFGCSLGMEVHFPEVFLEYERLDVDGVLVSTVGWATPGGASAAGPIPPGVDGTGVFAAEALAHAATNSYWVSYADTARNAGHAPSGIASPDGRWLARCPSAAVPAVVVADLDPGAENLARPWRRQVRAGVYDDHFVAGDPRSEDRATF